MSLQAALLRARALAHAPAAPPAPDAHPRLHRLSMGDPQAPLETVLGVLDAHGLLGADGCLLPEVQLVSMGDHFDWGTPPERARATEDGLALLSWLAAHPPDQVVILAGNHDLSRVGELWEIDAPTFEEAHARATKLYFAPTDRQAARAFSADFPMFPTVEAAARDLSTFSVEQRALVSALLRTGRMRLAWADGADLLLTHAGITQGDLRAAGIAPSSDARVLAASLNTALDAAISGGGSRPLVIPGLHTPGDAAEGEGGGVLYHRPANPALRPLPASDDPRRRLYDPRHLPLGLNQAIGHVRDEKSRTRLGAWADDAPAKDGVLRQLHTDGARASYAHGVTVPEGDQAGLVFLDAGMQHVPPATYPLFDLERRALASRRPPWVSQSLPRQ